MIKISIDIFKNDIYLTKKLFIFQSNIIKFTILLTLELLSKFNYLLIRIYGVSGKMKQRLMRNRSYVGR